MIAELRSSTARRQGSGWNSAIRSVPLLARIERFTTTCASPIRVDHRPDGAPLLSYASVQCYAVPVLGTFVAENATRCRRSMPAVRGTGWPARGEACGYTDRHRKGH